MEYFGSGDPPSGCFIAGSPTFIHGRAAEWARVLPCVTHVPARPPPPDCWNNTFLAVRSLDTSSEGDNGVIFSEFFRSGEISVVKSDNHVHVYFSVVLVGFHKMYYRMYRR